MHFQFIIVRDTFCLCQKQKWTSPFWNYGMWPDLKLPRSFKNWRWKMALPLLFSFYPESKIKHNISKQTGHHLWLWNYGMWPDLEEGHVAKVLIWRWMMEVALWNGRQEMDWINVRWKKLSELQHLSTSSKTLLFFVSLIGLWHLSQWPREWTESANQRLKWRLMNGLTKSTMRTKLTFSIQKGMNTKVFFFFCGFSRFGDGEICHKSPREGFSTRFEMGSIEPILVKYQDKKKTIGVEPIQLSWILF